MATILGMNLQELSLKDINEELSDLKYDLAVIEDFEKNLISFYEMKLETTFKLEDKQSIIEAIEKLKEEKNKRN